MPLLVGPRRFLRGLSFFAWIAPLSHERFRFGLEQHATDGDQSVPALLTKISLNEIGFSSTSYYFCH
jgi:hypothetical protein